MNWWHYLILANLYLALFYGFYLLLLRKETYFMLNRIYLVSAAVLSFLIPLIQSEWVKNLFITQKVQQTIYYIDPGFAYQITPSAESGFTVAQLFATVYWLVAMLLLARLFYRFFKLRKYLQTSENGSAFSFFNKIKVDENLPEKEIILQHELVHAIQFHSADVLLFEALTILNWFNPVIYFYRKAIKYNHEFIADRNAISFGVDKSDYALLLLSQTMNVQPNTLVNSFFNQSLLKQRIMMLHKNPSKRSALFKYGLSAPLFAAMLVLTSATVTQQKTLLTISEKISSDATVTEVAKGIRNEVILPSTPLTEKRTIKTVSTLNGKVVNPSGKPLANIKVYYKQNNYNTTTDEDGDFKIPNYSEQTIVNFKGPDSTILVRMFENVTEKLQIIVFEDRKWTENRAKRLVIKPSSEPGVVSFAAVEKLPTFPGGERAFGEYLSKAIRYPKEAHDNKTQGRVIVSFIVETDGQLNDIKILRDIGGGCGEEAVRVLSESPAWNPGIQNGKPVRVAYTMPVNFTLTGGTNSNRSTWSIGTNRDSTVKRVKSNAVTVAGFRSSDTTKTNTARIRENSGFDQALYIIDGEIKSKDELAKISPNDIESINVLKDTSATAKYGDKGKNGVIEITMKKGKKATETTKP
jgi:TonB family protein